jgi:hypothetical protein
MGALPLINAGIPGISATIPAGSTASLFPRISPSAVPSPAARSQADPGKQTRPVADSPTSAEFGTQVVGLIVVLLGVAIAITRISLRKSRAAGKSGRWR